MMKNTISMNVSAIGTDDGKSTFEVQRTWNEKGKKAIAIGMYPTISVENCGMLDVSNMHLLNHANDFGWGELRMLNLYATVVNGKPKIMLSNNLKRIRKSKGLSQEELAIKLNIVRQTVSKWENGLSVPDSDMLITLADELDTSVSVLLGETVMEPMTDDLKAISEKLEVINLQLAKRNMFKVKTIRWILITLCAFIVLAFIALAVMQSFYLRWDYNNPEFAVAGTILHGFEFVFVRLAPLAFIASIIGIVITYKKR